MKDQVHHADPAVIEQLRLRQPRQSLRDNAGIIIALLVTALFIVGLVYFGWRFVAWIAGCVGSTWNFARSLEFKHWLAIGGFVLGWRLISGLHHLATARSKGLLTLLEPRLIEMERTILEGVRDPKSIKVIKLTDEEL
jgi:hypothetical protein